MADKSDQPAISKVSDRPHAPFIFFDEAPVFNTYNGIIGITLAAGALLPDGTGKITNDLIVSGYLRGNIQAFIALRKAIDDAILLSAKTDGQVN